MSGLPNFRSRAGVLPGAEKAPRQMASGFVGLAFLALIMVVLPLLVPSSYVMRVAALVWIMALAAVGLHIAMGLAGQISLGHAGFFAIGAYATALLPMQWNVPIPLAVVAGVAGAGLLAYVVGKPILRLSGNYLAIATLGFSLIVGLFLSNEIALTGGPDGVNVRRLVIAGVPLTKPSTWYWVSAVLLLMGIALALRVRESPTGRALRAVLDSEVAAASMGVDVAQRKLQAFVIAAVYAAVAGATLALMNGFITPEVASFVTGVEFVAMVVIGGLSTPFGAVAGAALLTLLPQMFAEIHDIQEVLIGGVIMLSMIFLRKGIVPAVGALWRHRSAEK